MTSKCADSSCPSTFARSTDGGETWQPLQPFPEPDTKAHPPLFGYLYAFSPQTSGTASDGDCGTTCNNKTWRTSDGGRATALATPLAPLLSSTSRAIISTASARRCNGRPTAVRRGTRRRCRSRSGSARWRSRMTSTAGSPHHSCCARKMAAPHGSPLRISSSHRSRSCPIPRDGARASNPPTARQSVFVWHKNNERNQTGSSSRAMVGVGTPKSRL